MPTTRRFIDTAPPDIITRTGMAVRVPAAPGRVVITDGPSLALLSSVAELRSLAYRGGIVELRSPAELAALELADQDAGDNRYLDDLRVRGFLEVLLDEINILRAAASLPPRTPAQARAAIKTKIDELRAAL